MTSTLLALLFSLSSYHPYYVSIFEVQHNTETHTLQVAAKIFISDLEEALANDGHKNLYIGTEKETTDVDIWITEYLTEHFKLTTDGSLAELNFLGKETENDAIWCYLESKPIEQIDKLNVEATLLIEEFPTQTNLVHFTIWGTKTSAILRKGRTEKEILYEDLH